MRSEDITQAALLGVQAAMGEYYRLSGTDPNTLLSVMELAALAAKSQEMFKAMMKEVGEREP
jgi:hypothetical protein